MSGEPEKEKVDSSEEASDVDDFEVRTVESLAADFVAVPAVEENGDYEKEAENNEELDVKVSAEDGFAITKQRSDTQVSSSDLVKKTPLNINSTISVDPNPNAVSPSETPADEPKKPESPRGVDAPAVKLSKRDFIVTIIGLMLTVLLAALDSTIVATALPKIVSQFGRLDLYSWVIASYLLTSTIATPLMGKFSDIFGRKLMLQGASIIFLVGSALCGASPTMIYLIVFRAIQGIGGGALISMNYIILGDIVTVRDRGKYAGLNGLVFAVASVLGPVLGGVLSDYTSWRWCFYVNLPIGVIAFLVIQIGLKFPKAKTSEGKFQMFASIDFLGSFLLSSGVIFILLGTQFGGDKYAWDSAENISFFVFGGIAIILFGFVEWKFAKKPVISLGQFKIPSVLLANIMAFLMGWCMFGGINYLPVYFQVVRGDSPTISGLKMIPMMFGIIVGSIGSGIATSKTGRYWHFPPIASALLAIGFGVLYLIEYEWKYGYLVPIMFVIGLGIGILIQALVIIAQFFVKKSDLAVATSTVTFLRSMGGVIGVTVFGAILTSQLKSKLGEQIAAIAQGGFDALNAIPEPERTNAFVNYTDSLKILFVAAVPVSGIAFILSWFVKNRKMQSSKAKKGGDQQVHIETGAV